MSSFDPAFQVSLQYLNDSHQHRRRRVLHSPQGPRVNVDGRSLLNFCSNDYLGLANDPRVIGAFKRATDKFGVGSGASHLVSGHSAVHHQLEESLAEFTGRERALVFNSGYSANMAVIRSLIGVGDQIFHDRLNHASLLDGGWISRADVHWFEHRDYSDLKKTLHEFPVQQDQRRRLIVSDGVFSMDGDVCDVKSLVAISQNHNTHLMIDDAHGFGVLGKLGQGCVEPEVYSSDDVPILVGTFGKAFGTAGAFVAGTEALIEWLIQKARNYIFSTAMPSALAAASLTSLEIVQLENWRREHLGELVDYFVEGASQRGLPLLHSKTPIQPIVLNDSERCLAVSADLEKMGIFASAIRPPTVPKGLARIRITLSTSHTLGDVDQLLLALDKTINHE